MIASVAERTVHVDLGERSYSIEIGIDVLGQVGHEVRRRIGTSRAMLVTVPPVGRRYGPTVMRSLEDAGIKARRFAVPDGERSRPSGEPPYDAFMRGDRETAVIAGGVGGDLRRVWRRRWLAALPRQIPARCCVVDSMWEKTNNGAGKAWWGISGELVDGRHHAASLPPRQLAAGRQATEPSATRRSSRLRAQALANLEPEQVIQLWAGLLDQARGVPGQRENGLRMLFFRHTVGHE
jgi:hypothetical protein